MPLCDYCNYYVRRQFAWRGGTFERLQLIVHSYLQDIALGYFQMESGNGFAGIELHRWNDGGRRAGICVV